MNYYERHLGDYAKDTAHLSILEHGVYSLLLDRYYGTEQGIPADQAYRVSRARSDDERAAVDVVLSEFFELQDGVWINRRAEEEIAKAQLKIKAAQENGKKGGRPRKVSAGNDLGSENETQHKPSGFSLGSENETQQKAHQTPDTNTQEPNGSFVGVAHEHAKTTLPDDFLPNVAHRGLAVNQHLDLANELGMFVSHCKANATLSADWDASFEGWLRRSRKFGNGKDQQRQPQQFRQDAIANACDTLGVGSQYLSQESTHALR